MDILPKGWVCTTVGEVCDKPIQRKPQDDESFYYIDIASINRGLKKIEGASYIIGKDAPSRARKVLDEGDVIVSMTRPNLNAVSKINSDYAGQIASTGFDVLKPVLIETDWIFSIVKSEKFIQSISGITQGALYPACKAADIRSFEFGMPPLPEQKRIVEKLDSLLAQVDTIQQRLNNLPGIIKRFRQSVLAAAVSGKLTEQWREENNLKALANVAELNLIERKEKLNSRIQKAKQCERPQRFSIPCSWSWVSIDEACIKITDGTHHSPVSTPEGDYKYVTSKNVREGYIDLSKITYVSKKVHSEIYSRCDVVKGDVLYVKDGANTGLACVNNIDEEISLLSSVGVMKVASYLNPTYLQNYLNSPIGRKLMLDLMGGTAIKRLTLTKIKVSPLSLPPIEEQTEIVRLVEQYFALADTLEKNLAIAKLRVDNLTQSILAKAFRGELVPQDPNDEPADKLLARIKAARLEAEKLEKAAKKAAKASKK